jgi:hypothetical protein
VAVAVLPVVLGLQLAAVAAVPCLTLDGQVRLPQLAAAEAADLPWWSPAGQAAALLPAGQIQPSAVAAAVGPPASVVAVVAARLLRPAVAVVVAATAAVAVAAVAAPLLLSEAEVEAGLPSMIQAWAEVWIARLQAVQAAVRALAPALVQPLAPGAGAVVVLLQTQALALAEEALAVALAAQQPLAGLQREVNVMGLGPVHSEQAKRRPWRLGLEWRAWARRLVRFPRNLTTCLVQPSPHLGPTQCEQFRSMSKKIPVHTTRLELRHPASKQSAQPWWPTTSTSSSTTSTSSSTSSSSSASSSVTVLGLCGRPDTQ